MLRLKIFHMQRLRLFVLLIIMFAVPLQGYAAAAMVFCGPGHPAAVGDSSVERAAHLHADGVADAHHETGQVAESTAEDVASAHAASAEPDAMHKCGTCAACHATALIGTLQLLAFQDLPSADLSEVAAVMATLTPRQLDKPPRA